MQSPYTSSRNRFSDLSILASPLRLFRTSNMQRHEEWDHLFPDEAANSNALEGSLFNVFSTITPHSTKRFILPNAPSKRRRIFFPKYELIPRRLIYTEDQQDEDNSEITCGNQKRNIPTEPRKEKLDAILRNDWPESSNKENRKRSKNMIRIVKRNVTDDRTFYMSKTGLQVKNMHLRI